MARPVVRRIDHIIIRADGEEYAALQALFGETFGLPRPWPPSEHPPFTSAGVFAGNVDFELLKLKGGKSSKDGDPAKSGQPAKGARAPDSSPRARFYGIVFECYWPFDAFPEDLSALAARRIPYLPMPYVSREGRGAPATLWHNVFLGNLIGRNRWMDLLFLYKRLVPDRLWLRMMSRTGNNSPAAARFLFDTVYRDGIVFAVKYNPEWREIDAERKQSGEAFHRAGGGPLGLVRVRSMQVGLRGFSRWAAFWERFLAPHEKTGAAAWQVGDGPAIELVESDRNAICALEWEVERLERAANALDRLGIAYARSDGRIRLDAGAVCGLDIRLIERTQEACRPD